MNIESGWRPMGKTESKRAKIGTSDLSAEELEQIYDQVDADIKKNGLPTEEELRAEIQKLNETAVANGCNQFPDKL